MELAARTARTIGEGEGMTTFRGQDIEAHRAFIRAAAAHFAKVLRGERAGPRDLVTRHSDDRGDHSLANNRSIPSASHTPDNH